MGEREGFRGIEGRRKGNFEKDEKISDNSLKKRQHNKKRAKTRYIEWPIST